MPAYYVERKRQRDALAARKDAEGGLMAGVLSAGVAAQTRVRENKVPVEVLEEDGTVRLASGFEPPTPATQFHPATAMPPAKGDSPLVTRGQVSWHEALAAPAAATRSVRSGTRGIHTSAAMDDLAENRARYMDTLTQQTSWRPALAATFPRSQ